MTTTIGNQSEAEMSTGTQIPWRTGHVVLIEEKNTTGFLTFAELWEPLQAEHVAVRHANVELRNTTLPFSAFVFGVLNADEQSHVSGFLSLEQLVLRLYVKKFRNVRNVYEDCIGEGEVTLQYLCRRLFSTRPGEEPLCEELLATAIILECDRGGYFRKTRSWELIGDAGNLDCQDPTFIVNAEGPKREHHQRSWDLFLAYWMRNALLSREVTLLRGERCKMFDFIEFLQRRATARRRGPGRLTK